MQLPVELLVRILQDVDGRDLWMFRRVCKRWYELLSDLRIQRMLLPGLSRNQPFEHVKALSMGMPFRVSYLKLGGCLASPSLHEHLLFFEDYDKLGTLSLDLRTGEVEESYMLHASDGYVESKSRFVEDQRAVAVHNGTVCRWTDQGIDMGDQFLPWEIRPFELDAMAMDSRYVFLFGTGPQWHVFRINRITLERHYFACSGRTPDQPPFEVKPAGPLRWLVGYALFYLGEQPTFQPLNDPRAVWRDICYEHHSSNSLQVRALCGAARSMGHLDGSNDEYVFANDHYLVSCHDVPKTELRIFHMNPDSRQGQPIHREHPCRTLSGFKSGLEHSQLNEARVLHAKWVPISTHYDCWFCPQEHLPDMTLLS